MPSGHIAISVALCTYNGERFICEQLASILNQSKRPDEVVICDDCSHDRTVEMINSVISKSDVCVRLLINESNLGYVRNFEKAIRLCRGNVIFLSDQDDSWDSDKIKIMTEPFIKNNKIGLVYSDAEIVSSNFEHTGLTVFGTRRVAKLEQGQYRSIREVVRSPDLKGCLMAFRSNLIVAILPIAQGAEEFGWGHDHWIAQICHAMSGISVINRALMYYRRSGQNHGQDGALDEPWKKPGIVDSIAYSLRATAEANEFSAQQKTRHYELMLNRLIQIRNEYPQLVYDMEVLGGFINEYQESIAAIRKRLELRRLIRIRRLPFAARLLFTRSYRKHFEGFKSFARDILVK